MTYHSKKSFNNRIRVHDIFYGEHFDSKGRLNGHYFYCIHTQDEDINNNLFRDITGLLITTKEPLGYSCKIKINNKYAWVCCDREIRFMKKTSVINKKYFKPNSSEKKKVFKCFRKFQKEKTRQLRKGL